MWSFPRKPASQGAKRIERKRNEETWHATKQTKTMSTKTAKISKLDAESPKVKQCIQFPSICMEWQYAYGRYYQLAIKLTIKNGKKERVRYERVERRWSQHLSTGSWLRVCVYALVCSSIRFFRITERKTHSRTNEE